MGETHAVPATEPAIESEALDPRLLRALADVDNVRKRCERRLATVAEEERNRVLSQWLPIVDDLERALQYAATDAARVVQGVESVYEHALDVLARQGLERFDDIGRPFDPARHEAVGTIAADAPPGSIVAAAQPGYASRTGTVRPARVVVAERKSEGTSDRKPEPKAV